MSGGNAPVGVGSSRLAKTLVATPLDTYEKGKFNFDEEKYKAYADTIAELRFTNSDTIVYIRHEIQTLLDLLSKIAGYPNLFLILCGFFLGKFQRFYSNFEMYNFFNTEHCEDTLNSKPNTSSSRDS